MKKLVLTVLLTFIMLLGACSGISGSGGLTAADTELSKTVLTFDGNFSIDVPESWVKDYSYTDEEMADLDTYLMYTDNDIAFVSIYFYDKDYYDYNMNDALSFNLEYFGDSLIGVFEEMSLDGKDVFFFETSMVDLGVDGEEYNYHGFFYIINTPKGVAEIDIYYSQQIFESKISKPSEEQLLLLQEIAESFEIIE